MMQYDIDNCKHPLIEDDICQVCGNTVRRLNRPIVYDHEYTNTRPSKPNAKSIVQELNKLYPNIAIHIKHRMDTINGQMEMGTKRGYKRKQLHFVLYFEACYLEGESIDSIDAARCVGIDPSDIQNSFTMCSELETGYKIRAKEISPIDIIKNNYNKIPELYNNCDVRDHLINYGEEILDKDRRIFRSSLRNELSNRIVAGGIIQHFMNTRGISLSKSRIAEISSTTEMSIDKMQKRIAEIDNVI